MSSVTFTHFVDAQADIYEQALAELRAGRKRSHWMWFVFPQIAGLGFSEMSQRYALADRAAAMAYLQHPILGPRLIECCNALLAVQGKSAHEILGSPDDLKLRSCATLFAADTPAGSVFHQILERFFDGKPDPKTLKLIP